MGMQIGAATVENSMEFPQKIKNRTAFWPSDSTAGNHYGILGYTMEYYTAVKKKAFVPFAAAWMDLEVTILTEINQLEEDKYHIISNMCGI